MIGQIGSAALGSFGQAIRQTGQHNRQKELMGIQLQNQQILNTQGHNLSYEMWKKTNFPAQLKMLKEAGLNPALMYGQGGQGGTTQQSGGGSAMGAQAPMMDIGSVVQASLAEAQKKLLEAQANKVNTEADKIGGVDTLKGFAEIDKLLADTENSQANTELTRFKSEFQQIQNDLETRNFDANASIISSRAKQMIEDVHRLRRENRINDTTEDETIRAIELSTTKLALENVNLKKDLQVKDNQIFQIQENVKQNYQRIKFLYDDMNTQTKRNWNDYQLRKRATRIKEATFELQKLLGIENLKQGEARVYIDAIGTALGGKPSSGSSETWTSDGKGSQTTWERR